MGDLWSVCASSSCQWDGMGAPCGHGVDFPGCAGQHGNCHRPHSPIPPSFLLTRRVLLRVTFTCSEDHRRHLNNIARSKALRSNQLIDVSKVGIFPVGQILKRVHKSRVIRLLNAGCGQLILPTVLSSQVPTQEHNHNHKQHIAPHVCCKCDKVARSVP